ncbi:MAG TPA: cytochrome c oxidase subunit 3 [Burkholderiales bacterium]|nr:cytochrome c oxidase subunit 3 [Burkholderiales bacterium]
MSTIQFDNPLERRAAASLGMWAFLATEVMFFGPLFMGYVHGRIAQHAAFAEGSHHMHIVLGTLNTAILLTSSFTMALAVHASQQGRSSFRTWLGLTALLGLAFLGIKGSEYWMEAGEVSKASGPVLKFYFLYFAMTGLHAVHLSIGVVLVGWLWRGAKLYGRDYYSPIEVAGLYWHFVDIVWVFLYPMFYLIERYAK